MVSLFSRKIPSSRQNQYLGFLPRIRTISSAELPINQKQLQYNKSKNLEMKINCFDQLHEQETNHCSIESIERRRPIEYGSSGFSSSFDQNLNYILQNPTK